MTELEELAKEMIKDAERFNATTCSIGWERLKLNREWDLQIVIKKRQNAKEKTEKQ